MVRGLFASALFVAITALLGFSAAVAQLVRPRSDAIMRLGRLWSRTMLWAVGARVTYTGLEHTRTHLPCIFVSNHESNVDIWALIRVLPAPTRFVAKQSLFRVPFMGWAMSAGGFIPIDRGKRNRAIRSLGVAAERIRAGRPVLLFAEGTRSRDGTLQPFKKGPFHLALKARVPLVPVAIRGSWEVMRPGSLRVKPGPVHVEFLPAVDPGEFLPNDTKGLSHRMRETIRRAREAEQVA
jgi:1-acyl-sn-glycerol-3-phosphate acyltransferase